MPDKRCCPVTSGAIAERVVVVYHVLPSVVRNEQKESMMTKADLVAQIAARANMTKAAAERSLNAMLESVQEMLAEDGKLTLTGFGTFVAETRQERQGRNPYRRCHHHRGLQGGAVPSRKDAQGCAKQVRRKQMLHGETIHSPLPQDIPWWSPDFAVFFGVLYLVLFVIGTGVGYVILRSIWDTCRGGCGCHGEEHPAESH